jgi:long-chain acyl-CoA synthetase
MVLERVTAEIERINARHSRAAQIRSFFILDRELSHRDGELTPTMKVKRNVVYQKHAARFEALYGGVAQESQRSEP